MHPAIFLSLLPFALALPSSPSVVTTSTTAPAAPDPTTPFNVWVLKEYDGSGAIQHQFVNAADQAFYIGRGPATFCPLPPDQCPPVTGTSIVVNSGTASLDVVVPGGQQMYVRSNGALGYTQAHSASIPAGAERTGFRRTADNVFGFFGLGANGALVACPTGEAGDALGTEVYQVFAKIAGLSDADVPGGNSSACIGFDPVTFEAGVGAWQYT